MVFNQTFDIEQKIRKHILATIATFVRLYLHFPSLITIYFQLSEVISLILFLAQLIVQ